jgi:hypothetical protein
MAEVSEDIAISISATSFAYPWAGLTVTLHLHRPQNATKPGQRLSGGQEGADRAGPQLGKRGHEWVGCGVRSVQAEMGRIASSARQRAGITWESLGRGRHQGVMCNERAVFCCCSFRPRRNARAPLLAWASTRGLPLRHAAQPVTWPAPGLNDTRLS